MDKTELQLGLSHAQDIEFFFRLQQLMKEMTDM